MQLAGWRGSHLHTHDGCRMGARGNELPLPSCLPLAGGAACPACSGPRPPERHLRAVGLLGTPVFVESCAQGWDLH